MQYKTNYRVAVHWLHNNYILCNDIVNIDQDFEYPEMESEDEESNYEYFQFLLSDCSEDDVSYLKEHFDLDFGYSPLLGLHVLCVSHYGTSWDYVTWTTDLENAQAELGQTIKN